MTVGIVILGFAAVIAMVVFSTEYRVWLWEHRNKRLQEQKEERDQLIERAMALNDALLEDFEALYRATMTFFPEEEIEAMMSAVKKDLKEAKKNGQT